MTFSQEIDDMFFKLLVACILNNQIFHSGLASGLVWGTQVAAAAMLKRRRPLNLAISLAVVFAMPEGLEYNISDCFNFF